MNRRGFLAGMFGGVTSSGLILGKPFANRIQTPVLFAPIGNIDVGDGLYNARGELVACVQYTRERRIEAIALDGFRDYRR